MIVGVVAIAGFNNKNNSNNNNNNNWNKQNVQKGNTKCKKPLTKYVGYVVLVALSHRLVWLTFCSFLARALH